MTEASGMSEAGPPADAHAGCGGRTRMTFAFGGCKVLGRWVAVALLAVPLIPMVGRGLGAGTPSPSTASDAPRAATQPEMRYPTTWPESPYPTTWPDVKRPTARVSNCTEGNCHVRERGLKFLHGPVSVGACDVCHASTDAKAHKFELKRRKDALCNFCHVGKMQGRVVHKAVADGQCLGCHNPHGGAGRALLRTTNMGTLCASCHGDVTKGRSHAHGPVAAGNCSACHNAHSSELPKLLVAQGRSLCLGCHEEMNKQLKEVKFVHKPIEGDCLQCHEAHASNNIKQLKQPPLDMCCSCHEKIKTIIATATVKHSATTDAAACLNCHTPHGGDFAKLTKGTPVKVCLTCHAKDIKVDTRVVAGVPGMTDPALFKHGPIRDGNCGGCHTVHGGPFARLLAKDYATTFYQPFDLAKYSLCFSCHNKELVLLARTSSLTGFRNGDLSLHYMHVNKQTQGRNCRVCHETHYSKRPLHIRETVPYGQWNMPINFAATKTGGSCTPGCHQALSYDRVNPVPRPVTASTQPESTTQPEPTTQPSASRPGASSASP